MAELHARRILAWRTAYVLIGLAVIFYRILPLDTGTPGLPGPDFILCITLAWVLRQPASVPLGLILFLFLIGDFLLQRPPGLLTGFAVLGSEFLRTRRPGIAETPFLFEWAVVTGVILTIVIGQRVVLWILVADQPSLGLSLMEGLATIVIYPLVVILSKFILGMDKLPAVDLESGKP